MHGFVVALERAGFDVTLTKSLEDAERHLAAVRFDVVLLDVMIPITSRDEASGYSGEETDDSHKTGLAFYLKHKKQLAKHGNIMVFTVRVDKPIRDEFVAAGLKEEDFVTKLELRDARAFVEAVRKRAKR